MKSYQFRFILAGVRELTPEIADELYQATGGDIEMQMSNGIATLEFTRRSKSLRSAILQAIAEVENCPSGVRVVRVDSEAANTIAAINAELLQSAGG